MWRAFLCANNKYQKQHIHQKFAAKEDFDGFTIGAAAGEEVVLEVEDYISGGTKSR